MMNLRLLTLPCCLLLLLFAACGANSAPSSGSLAQEVSSSVAAVEQQEPAASSSVPASASDAEVLQQGFDQAFLEQAYALGYTDEMLETMKGCEFSPQEILDPRTSQNYTAIGTTDDGKYTLGSVGVEYIISYMLAVDNTAGTIKILPEIQNGFSDFGILDNQHYYAAISQVGGATYPAGVRIHAFANPEQPVSRWDLTTATMDGSGVAEKTLVNAYYDKSAGRMIVAHCEIPTQWGGWAAEDGDRSYLLTVLDTQAKVLFSVDTKILLLNGNTGIRPVNFDKPNAEGTKKDGMIYFDVDGEIHALHYESQKVERLGF